MFEVSYKDSSMAKMRFEDETKAQAWIKRQKFPSDWTLSNVTAQYQAEQDARMQKAAGRDAAKSRLLSLDRSKPLADQEQVLKDLLEILL